MPLRAGSRAGTGGLGVLEYPLPGARYPSTYSSTVYPAVATLPANPLSSLCYAPPTPPDAHCYAQAKAGALSSNTTAGASKFCLSAATVFQILTHTVSANADMAFSATVFVSCFDFWCTATAVPTLALCAASFVSPGHVVIAE